MRQECAASFRLLILRPVTLYLILQAGALFSIAFLLDANSSQSPVRLLLGVMLWFGLYLGWLVWVSVEAIHMEFPERKRGGPLWVAAYAYIIIFLCVMAIQAPHKIIMSIPGIRVLMILVPIAELYIVFSASKTLSKTIECRGICGIAFFLGLWLLSWPIPIGPTIVQAYVHKHLRGREIQMEVSKRHELVLQVVCLLLCAGLFVSLVFQVSRVATLYSDFQDSYKEAKLQLAEAEFDTKTLRPDIPLKSGMFYLSLKGEDVVDLGKLPPIRISTLVLVDTKVSTLAPLTNFPLRELHVVHAPITNIGLLAQTKLQSLDLQNCPITDLSPLNGLPLNSLSLQSTMVTNLEPIHNLQLGFLDIRDTKITDISIVGKMPLGTFIFDWENISEGLSCVRKMPSLKWISPEEGLMLDRDSYLKWEEKKLGIPR